jgi:hypothetical protein
MLRKSCFLRQTVMPCLHPAVQQTQLMQPYQCIVRRRRPPPALLEVGLALEAPSLRRRVGS